jgi:hypothetical protein
VSFLLLHIISLNIPVYVCVCVCVCVVSQREWEWEWGRGVHAVMRAPEQRDVVLVEVLVQLLRTPGGRRGREGGGAPVSDAQGRSIAGAYLSLLSHVLGDYWQSSSTARVMSASHSNTVDGISSAGKCSDEEAVDLNKVTYV